MTNTDISGGYAPPLAAVEALTLGYGLLNLSDGIVEYSDGTSATVDQMAKDVTTFLTWAAEPELEERHRTGVKVIIYLLLLTTLVYLSMKKIWSRIDTEV